MVDKHLKDAERLLANTVLYQPKCLVCGELFGAHREKCRIAVYLEKYHPDEAVKILYRERNGKFIEKETS